MQRDPLSFLWVAKKLALALGVDMNICLSVHCVQCFMMILEGKNGKILEL